MFASNHSCLLREFVFWIVSFLTRLVLKQFRAVVLSSALPFPPLLHFKYFSQGLLVPETLPGSASALCPSSLGLSGPEFSALTNEPQFSGDQWSLFVDPCSPPEEVGLENGQGRVSAAVILYSFLSLSGEVSCSSVGPAGLVSGQNCRNLRGDLICELFPTLSPSCCFSG